LGTTARQLVWLMTSGEVRRVEPAHSNEPKSEDDSMSQSEQKVVQYLNEAHATELGLVRVLQGQIAMTPTGTYRTGLEKHLRETRDHGARVQARLRELGQGSNPFQAGIGLFESALSQTVALWSMPLDLLRGGSGEEKVLKNAKDASATEALEIATYTALERLARSVGDDTTAELAASIREDEEKMLKRVLTEIPKLADAVVESEVEGNGSYDVTRTGAADAVREAGRTAKRTARKADGTARRTARQARRVPGVAQAEGRVKGAAASEEDLAIKGYDELTVEDIVGKLAGLSQIELARIDAYEFKHENRSTIRARLESLRGDEPWPGYDELAVADVRKTLADADEERVKATRDYERVHKNRAGVVETAQRELTNA
jgi:ferritin-like metal-binding protein YciE